MNDRLLKVIFKLVQNGSSASSSSDDDSTIMMFVSDVRLDISESELFSALFFERLSLFSEDLLLIIISNVVFVMFKHVSTDFISGS